MLVGGVSKALSQGKFLLGINIDSIFEFEENKAEVCKEKSVSVAIIDDEEYYDAFKNFGINAWIKSSDLSDVNDLLNLLEQRFLT